MAKKGWIKLYRSIVESYLWFDKPFNMGAAWVDLILKANHEQGKIYNGGVLLTIERGQLFTSNRTLADRWGWGLGRVNRFLSMIEKDGMITQLKTKQGTLITICKYDIFQLSVNEKEE